MDCLDSLRSSINITFHSGRKDFTTLKDKNYFDQVVSCWEFTPEIESVIHHIKYEGGRRLGRFIGNIVGELLSREMDFRKFDMMAPVPLHLIRKRERGYNQSELLCKGIVCHIDIPVYNNLIVRRRNTPSQTKLDGLQRQENVEGAFYVTSPEVVTGKKIILVDDVVTTGATMNSCAKSLINAGACCVVGISIARPELSEKK